MNYLTITTCDMRIPHFIITFLLNYTDFFSMNSDNSDEFHKITLSLLRRGFKQTPLSLDAGVEVSTGGEIAPFQSDTGTASSHPKIYFFI